MARVCLSSMSLLLLAITSYSFVLKEANHQLTFEGASHISKHFYRLSQIFQGYNLDFTLVFGSPPAIQSKNLLSTLGDTISIMESRVTISIRKLENSTTQEILSPYRNLSISSLSKNFRSVRVYMYNEAEFSQKITCMLKIQMHMQLVISSGIWPLHYILVGNLLQNLSQTEQNLQIYRHSVVMYVLNFRGIILFINYQTNTESLLCLACYPTLSNVFYHIQIDTHTSLENLGKISSSFNSQLHGAAISSSVTHMKPERLCMVQSILSNKDYIVFNDYTVPCAFHILKHKYNYTFISPRHPAPEDAFVADFALILNKNIEWAIKKTAYEWSPFLADYGNLYFIAYQNRPHISAAVIIRPFKWQVWIVFFALAVAVAVVTDVVEKVQKTNVKTKSIWWDMVSSILDQSISRNVQVNVNSKIQNLLPPWLGLWMFMMIVMGNSYTGMIASYIIRGVPAYWPETWKALLGDSDFLKITTEASNPYDDAKRENPFVSEMLMGNKNFTQSYRFDNSGFKKLAEALVYKQHFVTFTNYFKNAHLASDGEFKYILSGKHVKKIALVNFKWEVANLGFMSLYGKWMISSSPKPITGVVLPKLWRLYRNFFTEHFITGLGQLEQMGYRKVSAEYFVNLHLCSALRIQMHKEWLKKLVESRYNLNISAQYSEVLRNKTMRKAINKEFRRFASKFEEPVRKCRIVSGSGAGFNSLENYSKPLRLKQMYSLFLLFFIVLTSLALTLLCEKSAVILISLNFRSNFLVLRSMFHVVTGGVKYFAMIWLFSVFQNIGQRIRHCCRKEPKLKGYDQS